MQTNRLHDDFTEYLHHLQEARTAGRTTGEQEARPNGPIRLVDITIHDVYPEEPTTPPVIEGTLAEAAPDPQQDEPHTDAPEPGEEIEQPPPAAPVASRPSVRLHLSTLICLAVWGLVALAIGIWYGLVPLLTPPATVTLVPVSRAVTAPGTLTVVTGPANVAQQEIPGRVLGTITMSQAERVPTTGTGHQDAQAASGTITFYNAAPYVQTVSAGTLLTGADGVEIVTDSEAVIPAAVPPTEG